MKVMVMANNCPPAEASEQKSWYLLSDSAVTNTGKPFFLPTEEVIAKTGFAFKICRLGKHVDPKFASRYYSETAPVVHFIQAGYERELKKKGLPADPSRNFDKALFVGEFLPYAQGRVVEMKVNGKSAVTFDSRETYLTPEETVSFVSDLNSVKMGDLIIPGLSEGIKVKEGDLLEIFEGGSLSFHIKVK